MEKKNITIKLSKEESIVLFEFLGRFNEIDDLTRFEDQAEQRVLWDLESQIAKELTDPFRADYKDIVSKARNNLRDKNK